MFASRAPVYRHRGPGDLDPVLRGLRGGNRDQKCRGDAPGEGDRTGDAQTYHAQTGDVQTGDVQTGDVQEEGRPLRSSRGPADGIRPAGPGGGRGSAGPAATTARSRSPSTT
jgi:hypothetical protein